MIAQFRGNSNNVVWHNACRKLEYTQNLVNINNILVPDIISLVIKRVLDRLFLNGLKGVFFYLAYRFSSFCTTL